MPPASMKALPKRKGNVIFAVAIRAVVLASMKALPKRKGNPSVHKRGARLIGGLNESPSEKEGKPIHRVQKNADPSQPQ